MHFDNNKIKDIAKNVIEIESNALSVLSKNLQTCFELFINKV